MPDKRSLWKKKNPLYIESVTKEYKKLVEIFHKRKHPKVPYIEIFLSAPEKMRCNELHAFMKGAYYFLLKQQKLDSLSNGFLWEYLRRNINEKQMVAIKDKKMLTLIDSMENQEIHWRNSYYRRQIMQRKTFNNVMAGIRKSKDVK